MVSKLKVYYLNPLDDGSICIYMHAPAYLSPWEGFIYTHDTNKHLAHIVTKSNKTAG